MVCLKSRKEKNFCRAGDTGDVRIASLQPSISVTLAGLGRLEMLCAHTRYCVESVPELAALGLPVVEDSWSFDRVAAEGEVSSLTVLLESRPDVVLASVPYRSESLAAILKAGVPVLTLCPRSLANVYADIRLIGAVARAVSEAEALVAEMQERIAETRSLTAAMVGAERPVVYCEEWCKPLIHSQGWVAELVDAAGGWFLGVPGAQTTAEAVAAADPDVLVFAWCGAGARVPLARVIEQRGWQGLRAVRSGRVHCVPDPFLNTPAQNLLDGLACIAAATHPAIYPGAESSTAVAAMLSLAREDSRR